MPNPPAWHVDPSGRHEYRWWDGWRWTDSVADRGVVAFDPLHDVGLPDLPPPPAGPALAYDPVAVDRAYASAVRVTSGKAVAALCCGIAGLVVLPVIPSIVAIFLAVAARADIRERPETEGGGMATAGLVTGIVGVALWGLLIVIAIIAAAAEAAS